MSIKRYKIRINRHHDLLVPEIFFEYFTIFLPNEIEQIFGHASLILIGHASLILISKTVDFVPIDRCVLKVCFDIRERS